MERDSKEDWCTQCTNSWGRGFFAPSSVNAGLFTPPPPCPSNAYVQATLVASVNFCTLDFGSVFFNWSYSVLCVLSDSLALRYMMFIFCVTEADFGMMAWVAFFAPWFSEWYTMSFRMYHAQCDTSATSLSKQPETLVPLISGHLPLLGEGVGGGLQYHDPHHPLITTILPGTGQCVMRGSEHCALREEGSAKDTGIVKGNSGVSWRAVVVGSGKCVLKGTRRCVGTSRGQGSFPEMGPVLVGLIAVCLAFVRGSNAGVHGF